jgi:RNA polymerase sigma factor (TIGR02999 family)
MPDVTQILSAIDAGDPRAASQLLPLVYDELRQLAAAKMAHEKPGQTLDATALVHEAYVRLVGERQGSSPPEDRRDKPGGSLEFANRRHFFAAAAETMKRILVDRARRKQAEKHGGGRDREPLDQLEIALPEPREDVLALDEALQRLAIADPQAAELVHLRFFAGFSLIDAAEILGVAPRTAHRLWAYARAYLHREIQSS